ncbi:MAG TPA: hypothetical protein VFR81_18600 [Longimicrobium sp.]|nr:hypothetical protein [Longimicrobium sp.]
MPNKTQPKGTCACCGAEIARGGATRHLEACRERRAAIEKADAKAERPETLLHLRVQDEQDGTFWLDLEMRGTARIDALDHYLRAIWLECCGHLSRFEAGSRVIGMARPAASVIQPGVTCVHTYDFGTTSYTLVKLVGTRTGAPTTKHPIALLARNLMPGMKCIKCDQPATRLCTECWIEDEVWGTLCPEHARKHPHRDYGRPIPLVNSPRLGMCGYDGPAKPPY